MASVKRRTVFNDITHSTNNQEILLNHDKNSSHKRNGKSIVKRSLKNKQTHITITNNVSCSSKINYLIQPPDSSPEQDKQDPSYEDQMRDMLAVKEYSQEIFTYLYELDYTILKNMNTIYSKKDIINRETLINWIIKIHSNFGFFEETLYLAVYIIDKFQTLDTCPMVDLQLLGITSLFIASKVEEIMIPRAIYFSYQTDGVFTVSDITNFELKILEVLQYNLTYANPLNFIRRMTKADDYNLPRRTIAKYLLEITLIDSKNFNKFSQGQCAAAAMLLSRRMFGKHRWGSDLIKYSGGYVKKDIIFICKMLIKYLLSPIAHVDFQSKYESSRYLRASIICKEWVLAIMKQQREKKLKKKY